MKLIDDNTHEYTHADETRQRGGKGRAFIGVRVSVLYDRAGR